MPRSVRAVLLDVDGTLVDSNDAHALAWVETLAEFGHDVAFARIRPLIGTGGEKILHEAVGLSKDSAEGKCIGERRGALFRERYLPKLKPLPGARALLERLHADGLRLVVATSAREEEMKGLLKVADAEGLLYEATSSSDAKHSKPDPDIVRAALEKAECEPERALMIGDTPYDIEAAARASVATLAFRSGGWNDAALMGALAIYDGPQHLLEQYASSPLVR